MSGSGLIVPLPASPAWLRTFPFHDGLVSSIPSVDSQGSDASFFEGASVLVTGGAGFIGSHLVEHLLAAGARVSVLDDLSTGRTANLPAHPRLRLIRASILDRTVLAAAGRVDLVFHL